MTDAAGGFLLPGDTTAVCKELCWLTFVSTGHLVCVSICQVPRSVLNGVMWVLWQRPACPGGGSLVSSLSSPYFFKNPDCQCKKRAVFLCLLIDHCIFPVQVTVSDLLSSKPAGVSGIKKWHWLASVL